MNELLTRLGVPGELQAFFQTSELSFDYGDDAETFDSNGHFVPSTADLWMAGSHTASELILTYSVMEAIAYLATNRTRHPQLNALSFIALGTRPAQGQFEWIRSSRQKRKITMAFGHDLPGRLTDIVVAAGIRNLSVDLRHEGQLIAVVCRERTYRATAERISLNAFEKATGIRTAIRTRKPNQHNTFLEQLLYEANR